MNEARYLRIPGFVIYVDPDNLDDPWIKLEAQEFLSKDSWLEPLSDALCGQWLTIKMVAAATMNFFPYDADAFRAVSGLMTDPDLDFFLSLGKIEFSDSGPIELTVFRPED